MNILVGLLILLLLTYLWGIIKSITNARRIKNVLEVLKRFLESADCKTSPYDGYMQLYKRDDFQKSMNEALMLVPTINRRTKVWCDMDYSNTDEDNYKAAASTYNKLLMKQNYAIDDLMQSLNPVQAIKNLFQLPSILLKFLGINMKIVFSRLWNIVCWIIVYLLGAYQNEIKMLLKSVFH